MIINDSDLIICLIPIVISWVCTICTIIWKFDRRISNNEIRSAGHENRISKCEKNIEKHETRIDKIEVKIANG